MKDRREFLLKASALGISGALPAFASAASANERTRGAAEKLVVMVYLKAGNDAYNTLVPLDNPRYYTMRPNIALKREQTILLNPRQGLNRSLQALMPLWQDGQLALLQGIGQQEVTNQHYRDAETQFTGAGPDEYYDDGWMTRAFARNGKWARDSIDAFAFGDLDIREADPMGPFRGGGARLGVVNLLQPTHWLSTTAPSADALLTTSKAREVPTRWPLRRAGSALRTPFPQDSFGTALQATVELAAAGMAPPVVHITLNSEDGDHHHAFDTHWDQLKYHGPALTRLAEGLAAFRGGMQEIGRWQDTLLFTYDEFGRSPKENEKQGTHHGWAGVHLVTGGRVKGGLLGEPMPVVDVFQIDGPPPVIDYHALYTTVIESFLGGSASGVFKQRFKPLDILRA